MITVRTASRNFQGDLELRKAVMYCETIRGVHVRTSQIVVAAGMENLLFYYVQILGRKVSIGIENQFTMRMKS